MYVLGIETSCDETAAAIVVDGKKIISSQVSSSLEFHSKYGGVVPEIAFRIQLETIAQVTDDAIKKAKIKLSDIGLISVTNQPGLLGSLLVGIAFAKSLSLARGIPLLGVNHLYSHIYANMLADKALRLPFTALIVSGGHTSIFYIKDFDQVTVLGQTQDDACGEAFDKVAKILGLGYPGGPLIEQLAKKGDAKKIKFNCSDTDRKLDFSFSGIKTAVLYYIRDNRPSSIILRPSNKSISKADVAASFQEAAIDTLIKKSLLACEMKKTKSLAIGGGVAANSRLREKFVKEATKRGVKCFFPPKSFCLDNAAMVAGFGYRLFKKGYISDLRLGTN
ncbi:MAG: tRNA (adenosine(37)-N6)-threonylcarbamoyltransferase complex transferase subunit TsaD [Candidatus Omnitrophica bacterium]|nr:tRNA (adenosine(37)-N6)-threonylcarbamoyltransferase complex transferase subunit TsaD [Candidatus Omnitrophota bacterium]